MAPPAKAEKTMSSRLLTMKFMQRAVASKSPTSPSSPSFHSNKRQRTSLNAASPSTPLSDSEAIQAALAAEDEKRQKALDRQAAEAGETKWVLSFRDEDDTGLRQKNTLNVVSAGYAAIDAVDQEEDDEDEEIGRRTFGNVKTKKPSHQPAKASNLSSSSDDDSPSDSDDDSDPAAALIRSASRDAATNARKNEKATGKRKSRPGDAPITPDNRQRKQVKQSRDQISSISSASGPNRNTNIECHQCKQKGHMKRDCPMNNKRKEERTYLDY